MSIKQVNVKYYPHDDRIIFRFNTIDHSEFKLWLTRRVTHSILKSAVQLFEKEHDQHATSVESVISDIQKSDKQASYSEAYESGVQYPIGADAVLVVEAKCQMVKVNDQDVFSLDFILPGGGNINLKLTLPIMRNIVLLLEEANIQAKWV